MSRRFPVLVLVCALCMLSMPLHPSAEVTLEEALYELEYRTAGASARLEGEEITPDLLSTLGSMSTEELEAVVWHQMFGQPLPEMKSVAGSPIEDLATGVCIVVSSETLHDTGTGYRLDTDVIDVSYIGGFDTPRRVAVGYKGTGFLVGKAWVATAGHVIDCGVKDVSFVFGFKVDEGKDPEFPYSSVARGDCFIGWQEDTRGGDWALIQLDSAPDEAFHRIEDSDTAGPSAGAPVFVVGHPAGLPMQYVEDSVVWDNGDVSPPYFRSSLRTYSGNSGSPIFSGGKAVGIHNGGTYPTGPLHSELDRMLEIKPFTIFTSTVNALAYRVGEGRWNVLPRGRQQVTLAVRPGQRVRIMGREGEGRPLRPLLLPEGRRRIRIVERTGLGPDASASSGVFDFEEVDEDFDSGDSH